MHACMHACMHAYMHTCIHASCIHAYMHTCIHAYMHACTYTPTHLHNVCACVRAKRAAKRGGSWSPCLNIHDIHGKWTDRKKHQSFAVRSGLFASLLYWEHLGEMMIWQSISRTALWLECPYLMRQRCICMFCEFRNWWRRGPPCLFHHALTTRVWKFHPFTHSAWTLPRSFPVFHIQGCLPFWAPAAKSTTATLTSLVPWWFRHVWWGVGEVGRLKQDSTIAKHNLPWIFACAEAIRSRRCMLRWKCETTRYVFQT